MTQKTSPVELIDQWLIKTQTEIGLSGTESEELKGQVQEELELLRKSGLDEEEAYIIGTDRIKKKFKIEVVSTSQKKELLDARRSAVILSGVLIYFLSFHLVGSTTKTFLVILLEAGIPLANALSWMLRFLITWHFLFILLFTSILLAEKKVIEVWDNIKIRPLHIILILIVTVIFGFYNAIIMTSAKRYMQEFTDLMDHFFSIIVNFRLVFPFLFCMGFILIYYKYYRKAKIRYYKAEDGKSKQANTGQAENFVSEESDKTTEQIEIWIRQLRSKPSFTDADAEELKTHLLDIMDGLMEAGLSENEAYRIASRRLGSIQEIEEEYREENREVIQTRRSAIILSGVLLYFFCFHLLESIAKTLIVLLDKNNVPDQVSIHWMKDFLAISQYFFIFLFLLALFFEKKVLSLIEYRKVLPREGLILLLTTGILALYNNWLTTYAKDFFGSGSFLRSRFIVAFFHFEYTFPLIFCVGFILIYSKFHKKFKF